MNAYQALFIMFVVFTLFCSLIQLQVKITQADKLKTEREIQKVSQMFRE